MRWRYLFLERRSAMRRHWLKARWFQQTATQSQSINFSFPHVLTYPRGGWRRENLAMLFIFPFRQRARRVRDRHKCAATDGYAEKTERRNRDRRRNNDRGDQVDR